MNLRRLRAGVRRLLRGITHPEEELSRAQRRVAIAWSAARFAAVRLRRHKAPQLAAALAYRTIFSIIPMLVLALVALRAVYGEEGIREVLSSVIDFLGFDALTTAPERGAEATFDASREIEAFVDRAVERVRDIDARPVAVIGLGVLIYSALSLLFQIESSFNAVCEASRRRTFMTRVTTYWTLTTIGALALFVMLSIGNATTVKLEQLPGWLHWSATPLRVLGSVGATWLLLIFAYMRMPSVRVHLRPAAIGAAVAAIAWEVIKTSVTGLVGVAFAGQVEIYSSLALIPVSLLWVYLTWLIVLYGLEVTHLLQVTPAAIRRSGISGPIMRTDVVLDIGSVAAVARAALSAFQEGEPVRAETLMSRTGLTHDVLEEVLRALHEQGVLVEVEQGEGEERRYTIARAPERITMDVVVKAAQHMACTPGGAEERRAATDVRERAEEALKAITLAGGGAPLD